MQISYDELRKTYMPAEELAELVARGCPVDERGDPHPYLMALLVPYVASELEPHLVGGELDAQLIDDVADLVASMMLHVTEAADKEIERLKQKLCAVGSIG